MTDLILAFGGEHMTKLRDDVWTLGKDTMMPDLQPILLLQGPGILLQNPCSGFSTLRM
jgi:hypothetical protein